MTWLDHATNASVVRRASAVAAVVGTILVLINHGDARLQGNLTWSRALQIALTLLVPYCVSTYSSVAALQEMAAPETGWPDPSPDRIPRV
jgi:hypothetical protein